MTGEDGATVRDRQAWLAPLMLGLSVAGLAVSLYLTIAHFTSNAILACGSGGTVNCERVITSPESFFFGVPVAILGLFWFVAMTALCVPRAWRSSARWVTRARALLAVAGIGFVLWLVYAELYRIGAICLWCTVVHVITFVLFVLIVTQLPARDRSRD